MDKKIIKSIIARQQELVCNVEFINTKPLFVSARDEVVGKHCRLVACLEIWGGRGFLLPQECRGGLCGSPEVVGYPGCLRS